jgi:hypothetical protein
LWWKKVRKKERRRRRKRRSRRKRRREGRRGCSSHAQSGLLSGKANAATFA